MTVGAFVLAGLDHVPVDSNFVHLIFDGFGRCRVGSAHSGQGAQTGESQKDPEDRAGDRSAFLSRWRYPNAPGDPCGPDAVGQMEHACKNTHEVEQRPDKAQTLHRLGQRTGCIIRSELGHSQRLDKAQPPVPMEPTVKMQHMGKDEGEGNVARHPLGPIPLIASKAVVPQIRLPAPSDPNSDDRMEEDRQENKRPFDHRQKRKAVDRKDCILKNCWTSVEARIGQQVDAHVSANGHESAQGVESPNDKVVLFEESREGPTLGGGRRRGNVHAEVFSAALTVSIAGEPPVKCTGPTVLGRVFRHRETQKAYLNVL